MLFLSETTIIVFIRRLYGADVFSLLAFFVRLIVDFGLRCCFVNTKALGIRQLFIQILYRLRDGRN